MSIIPQLAHLAPLIQDNTLRRWFEDALYNELLFRMEATPETWDAETGDTYIATRGSLLPVQTIPLTAGQDPSVVSEAFEQWKVTACQYGIAVDTGLPQSRAALASKFSRDARSLALNAGQSLNRIYRNKLFVPYCAGTTHADVLGSAALTMLVGSISGFTKVLVDGEERDVSVANPKAATVDGTVAVSVTGAVATDPVNFPLGAGTLTFAVAASWSAGDVVVAVDATAQVISGGGESTDALASTDVLKIENIRDAVATLQGNAVPPHEDGQYHVHIDPLAVSQLFADTEYQNLNQSLVEGTPYKRFAIGQLLASTFYRNNEAPSEVNTGGANNAFIQPNRPNDAAPSRLGQEISADVRNKAGVAVLRTIVTGGGSGYEKYIPEADYITEAGVTGKIGGFSVYTGGMQINVDRIRYILRAPIDRNQQTVSQAWSWSGDFGIPSDLLGGRGPARFKRAVVINSGRAG